MSKTANVDLNRYRKQMDCRKTLIWTDTAKYWWIVANVDLNRYHKLDVQTVRFEQTSQNRIAANCAIWTWHVEIHFSQQLMVTPTPDVLALYARERLINVDLVVEVAKTLPTSALLSIFLTCSNVMMLKLCQEQTAQLHGFTRKGPWNRQSLKHGSQTMEWSQTYWRKHVKSEWGSKRAKLIWLDMITQNVLDLDEQRHDIEKRMRKQFGNEHPPNKMRKRWNSRNWNTLAHMSAHVMCRPHASQIRADSQQQCKMWATINEQLHKNPLMTSDCWTCHTHDNNNNFQNITLEHRIERKLHKQCMTRTP